MDLLAILRDPIWQAIGVIITAISLWYIPALRESVLSFARKIEKLSFVTGLISGALIMFLIILVISPKFTTRDTPLPKQHVKVYDSVSKQVKLLEGSHYTLKPDSAYKIEIENLDSGNNLLWDIVPENFGVISYDSASYNSISKSITADYITPRVPEGSSGFIKICEFDESNLCRNLNLPEIQVVITSK